MAFRISFRPHKGTWLAAALLGLTLSTATAQQPVVMNWARTDFPAGVQHYQYDHVAAMNDGNFAVAGHDRTGFTSATSRALIRVIRPNGTVAWERTFPGLLASPGLRFDNLRILPDGSLYLTAIGNSGLVVRLNASTGATISSLVVPDATQVSAIGPDSSTYFASTFTTTTTDLSDPNNYYRFTAYRVRVRRISNTLVESFTTFDAGFIREDGTLAGYTLRDQDPPLGKFVFYPGGCYFLSGSTYIYSDTYTPLEYRGIFTSAQRINSDGTFGWQNFNDRAYNVLNQEQLDTLKFNDAQAGVNAAGSPQFNYLYSVFDGAAGAWLQLAGAISYGETTGTISTPAVQQLYDNFQSQNGFLYRYTTNFGRTFDAFYKTNPSTSSTLWSVAADTVSRLPFQLFAVRKNLTSMIATRRNDAAGSIIDEFTFAAAPETLHSTAQSSLTGDVMVIGSKPVTGGRFGGFVSRLSQAPTAVGNTYTTPRNTVLTAPSVLLNDRFAAGLTAQTVTLPRNGTLNFTPSGEFRYTPRTGYAGSDSFTYRTFRPGILVFSTATVFINVTP